MWMYISHRVTRRSTVECVSRISEQIAKKYVVYKENRNYFPLSVLVEEIIDGRLNKPFSGRKHTV